MTGAFEDVAKRAGADLREEGKVIVSDEELEPGRESLREALVLGLASFSETVPGAWHFCGW